MFTLPAESSSRLIFFVFTGLLCAVLLILAAVYAGLIIEITRTQWRAVKASLATKEKRP